MSHRLSELHKKLRRRAMIHRCFQSLFLVLATIVFMYILITWKHYDNEEDRSRLTDIIVVDGKTEDGCPPRRVIIARQCDSGYKFHYEVKPCFWLGITRKESAQIWKNLEVGKKYRITHAEINGFKTIEYVESVE